MERTGTLSGHHPAHADNPSGNSYGWGYNGLSGGSGVWIEETVDLSSYAGEVVQLRFEYITDAAVHGEGLLLDTISIPEIGYSSDFESDDGGWTAEGFVRIMNQLATNLQAGSDPHGCCPRVEYLSVPGSNELEILVEKGSDGSHPVILVVTGNTRFTRQEANYWIELITD